MEHSAQRQTFLQDILQPVIDGHSNRTQELCGFMAMEGAQYTEGRKLMVVGRAVNSWGKGFTADELSAETARNQFVNQLRFEDRECQMEWVNQDAGKSDRYNTNQSSFWRVVREVSRRLEVWPDAERDSWASHLVWSNLYKISPHDGGNPSNKLCELQESGCIELLREEIREFNPDMILFLTGMSWAWPFMQGLGCCLRALDGLAEARGEIRLVEESVPVPFVVAHHPQGKTEDVWVDQVVEASGVYESNSGT